MQTLFTNLVAEEFISKTSLMSFPQAERVGNPSEKRGSGQSGMTKLGLLCSVTTDRITNLIAYLFMRFGG